MTRVTKMSDVFYTPPAADLQFERQEQPAFFSVAPAKLIVMTLLTHGIYMIYWLYKSWDIYKLHSRRPIWPVARTVLSVFYMPSMLCKIDRFCKAETGSGMPYWRWSAALFVLLPFSSFLIGFVIGLQKVFTGEDVAPLGLWLDFLIGTVSLVIQALLLLRAQRFINLVNGDPAGLTNNRFSALNGIWIAVGLVTWIAVSYWAYANSVA